MKTEREKKKEELGMRLTKVNQVAKSGLITETDKSIEIDKITKEASALNICANEILSDAMDNKEEYEKRLAKVAK